MSVLNWSPVPDRNGTADPSIRAVDALSARDIGSLMRGIMAGVAALSAAQGGTLVTRGTENVYVVATDAGVTLRAGVSVSFWADRSNTGAPFLNIDGTGPKPWRDANGADLRDGDIRAGAFYTVVWNAAIPGAPPEWRMTVGGRTGLEGTGISAGGDGLLSGMTGMNILGKGDSSLFVRPAFNLDNGVVLYSASRDFSTPRNFEVLSDRLVLNAQRGVTILPKANSLEHALNVVQSGPASGSVAGPVILNGFDVSWSSGLTGQYGTPGLVGAAALAAFQVSLNVGGPNLAGTQFIALSAGITHDRSDTSDGDKFAISGGVHSTANTNGLLDGSCFSVVVDSGSYTPQAAGTEVDMAILGSGRTPNRLGFVAVNTGSKTAERADIAYAATSAGPDGTIGGSWKTLIGLYKQSTTLPDAMQPTGRIFESDHDLTIADVLYGPNIAVTGDILRFPHMRLRGDGTMALGDVEPTLTNFCRLQVQASSATRAAMIIESGVAPDAAHTRAGQFYSNGANLFFVDNQGVHRRLAFAN